MPLALPVPYYLTVPPLLLQRRHGSMDVSCRNVLLRTTIAALLTGRDQRHAFALTWRLAQATRAALPTGNTGGFAATPTLLPCRNDNIFAGADEP